MPAGKKRATRRANAQEASPAARSFYLCAIEDADAFIEASEVEGLDGEVAVLRVRLKQMVEKQPENYELLVKMSGALVRAVSMRYRMSPERTADLATIVANTLDALREQVFGPGEDAA